MLKAIKIDPETRDILEIALFPNKVGGLEAFACHELCADRLAYAAKTDAGDTLVVDPDRPKGEPHFYLKDIDTLVSGPALLIGPTLCGRMHEPRTARSYLRTQIEFVDPVNQCDWIAAWGRRDGGRAYPSFTQAELTEHTRVPRFYSVRPRRAIQAISA